MKTKSESLKNRSDAPVADPDSYLSEIAGVCQTDWPKNRTIHIVCHGHSVPSGYFKTPKVLILKAYPHRLLAGLSKRYPHAVINVIVTGIGGENSLAGSLRFESEVLNHQPDLVTIDYALNDRRVGLEPARRAWIAMIEAAQRKGVKLILLTPTPDLAVSWDDPSDPLNQHAEQVRKLAEKYHVGLVDSLVEFQRSAAAGHPVATLMSQGNHPNAKGHALVAKALLRWFPKPESGATFSA